MKINFDSYYQIYHQQGDKFIDRFQSEFGLYVLPFTSNTTNAFDKRCGLWGAVGEFFRKQGHLAVEPINSFEYGVKPRISEYLLTQRDMPENQINLFLSMLEDILYINGNLNITDSSLLKYIPPVPYNEELMEYEKKKYLSGLVKLVDYLCSMQENLNLCIDSKSSNLFSFILRDALDNGASPSLSKVVNNSPVNYYILPYIKRSFQTDISWLMNQSEPVILKYIHLFLHFYTCYSMTQTIISLSPEMSDINSSPTPLYYILASEKTSHNSDAILRGWTHKVPKVYLDKLYGRIQAIDIINCALGGSKGLYPELLERLRETPFEENKEACEAILLNYQEDKIKILSDRDSEVDKERELLDISVDSYEAFFEKLCTLCVNLQSTSYVSRMRKKVLDIMSIRFLQLRRGKHVLVIDNEMLIFLIGLFTQGKRMKLEEMYVAFNKYGIHFNIATRNVIEELLLKLNLLDRKSDSGEAQYVKVIL